MGLAKSIFIYGSFILGLALLIPGAVLLEQSAQSEDDSSFDGMPLLIIGAILTFIGVCGVFGNAKSHSGPPDVPGSVAQQVRDNTQVGLNNGYAAQQQQNQFNNWMNGQQAQMQYSINNPC